MKSKSFWDQAAQDARVRKVSRMIPDDVTLTHHNIGEILAAATQYLAEFDISQVQLARAIGTNEAYISDLFGRKRDLPVGTRDKLLRAINNWMEEDFRARVARKPENFVELKSSKRIIEAARAAGCILATGENIRRGLSARACAWALTAARLIGDVRMVNVQLVSHSPFDYTRPAAKWRGIKRLTGGGMIMDSGAHLADMVQVLFGPVDEVWCTMQTLDTRTIEGAPVIGSAPADVEDTWHAVTRFASGLHLTWTYSRSLYGPDVRLGNYYGSAGMMQDLGFVFHPFQGGGEAHLADGSTVSKEDIEQAYLQSLSDRERERLFPYGATDGFAIEVWDFVHAIATGDKPEMDGMDGLRAKALCEACYESAVARRPVRYADVLASRIDAYQAPIDAFWGID